MSAVDSSVAGNGFYWVIVALANNADVNKSASKLALEEADEAAFMNGVLAQIAKLGSNMADVESYLQNLISEIQKDPQSNGGACLGQLQALAQRIQTDEAQITNLQNQNTNDQNTVNQVSQDMQEAASGNNFKKDFKEQHGFDIVADLIGAGIKYGTSIAREAKDASTIQSLGNVIKGNNDKIAAAQSDEQTALNGVTEPMKTEANTLSGNSNTTLSGISTSLDESLSVLQNLQVFLG